MKESYQFAVVSQLNGTVLNGSFPKLRTEVVVWSRIAGRVVERLRRYTDIGGELVQQSHSFCAEIVAEEVAPPSPFGLK